MPYIKSRDIRGTPLCSLKYICNPDKTNSGLLVSAVGCMSEPKNAYEEMKRVYEFYSGRSFNEPIPENGKGKVKLIHYIQSFDPKEKISADTANEIALATVKKMFGENVQAVIATHNETEHIHNHFMVNVYNLEGKRFYSNQNSLKKLKRISDEVCLQFGVQPYDKTLMSKPAISAYNEWEHLKKGTSWKQQIRNKIDLLIPTVRNIDELLAELEQRGYTIKRGKYISLKAPEQQRFVRTKTLGEAYTEKNIIKRIFKALQINSEKFHDSYYNLCGKFIQGCGAYRFTKPAIAVHDFYYGQYVTLVKENLNSIDMVRSRLSEAEKLCAETEAAVSAAYEKHSEAKNILKLAERYFSEMSGVQRLFPKSQMDKAAVSVVRQYNLKSESDIGTLRDSMAEAKSELDLLKNNYAAISAEVRKYRDIADTYDMMNSGEDYISRLVREVREKCSLDEWDEVVRKSCEAIRNEISNGKIIASGKIQRDIADTIILLNGRIDDSNDKLCRLIRYLAVLRADNISNEKELAKHIGQMKSSEASADLECKAAEKQVGELREDIHRIEIYLHNKDGQFPNQEWLEVCRRSAEKHGVYDISGLDRLNATLADITKKVKGLEARKQFYYSKARDYSQVRELLSDIRRSSYAEKIVQDEYDKEQLGQVKSANKKRQR